MRFVATINLVIFLLLAACVAGCASAASKKPGYERFVANSAQVQHAKRTYALGHNVPAGTEVTWLDLATCLPANWKAVCPSGGILSPGRIGEQMKCTVHGQLPAGYR